MGEIIQASINDIVELGDANDWISFDIRILDVCDQPDYLDWATKEGLADPRLNARDLAISIFENTNIQPILTENQEKCLHHVLTEDENLHLRRKSAFALFKYGNRTATVIDQIKEAAEKDDELRYTAQKLLEQFSSEV